MQLRPTIPKPLIFWACDAGPSEQYLAWSRMPASGQSDCSWRFRQQLSYSSRRWFRQALKTDLALLGHIPGGLNIQRQQKHTEDLPSAKCSRKREISLQPGRGRIHREWLLGVCSCPLCLVIAFPWFELLCETSVDDLRVSWD